MGVGGGGSDLEKFKTSLFPMENHKAGVCAVSIILFDVVFRFPSSSQQIGQSVRHGTHTVYYSSTLNPNQQRYRVVDDGARQRLVFNTRLSRHVRPSGNKHVHFCSCPEEKKNLLSRSEMTTSKKALTRIFNWIQHERSPYIQHIPVENRWSLSPDK